MVLPKDVAADPIAQRIADRFGGLASFYEKHVMNSTAYYIVSSNDDDNLGVSISIPDNLRTNDEFIESRIENAFAALINGTERMNING